MSLIPSELAFGDVYLPPILVAGLLGVTAAWVTAQLLNRFGWSRFFFYPPLVLIALAVIYTVIFGTWVIPA